jgi:hypothetical protein
MHRFGDAEQISATSGARGSAMAVDRGTPVEQARNFLYTAKVPPGDGGEEVVIMPAPNVFACLISAGRFFKSGRSKLTTATTSLVPAAVSLPDMFFVLEHDGWSVDTRAVRIPATGGRIQRHRPIFHNWGFTFDVVLDTSEISESLFRQLVDAAGSKVGLGNYRPERKGPFGRFRVDKWEARK